jgi:hypothetical protein
MEADPETFASEVRGAPPNETAALQRSRTRHRVVTPMRERDLLFRESNEIAEITTVLTDKLPDPVVTLPVTTRPIPREVKLQEWEGQVQVVNRKTFTATLTDVTAGSAEESIEVDLLMDDLSDGDQELVVPGAIFRWIVGHTYTYGQKDSFSRIVMRRLPIWTTHEIKEADREAEELYNALFQNGSRGHSTAGSD